MLSTLIIVFREVLEATLVAGIAMAAAREASIHSRWIYIGISGGVVAAMLMALFAGFIADSMSGMGQEIFNAAVLLSASLFMAWTAIWMGKHGREVSANIRQVCQQQERNPSTGLILAVVVGLAVAREGAEVVLFLYGVAVAGESGATAMFIGAAAGLFLGIIMAVILYRSLVRIPIRYVFAVLRFLIVLLAAGMASQGVAYLVMIDVLPALGQIIWNTSALIPQHSITGQVLHALMGYDDRPSGMQVLAFIGVFSITWLATHRQKAMLAKTVGAVMIVMSMCMSPDHAQAREVYSPIVKQGEVEIEYLLDYSLDGDPAKNDSAKHQFEMEYGVTDRWMTAVYGVFRKKPRKNFTYDGFKWENIYQLFEQGEHWLDAGLYLEYFTPKKSLNAPETLEFKLLLEKETGRFIHTANLILEQKLGGNAGGNPLAAYAWRSKWRWKQVLEPAIEWYSSFGALGNIKPTSQQSHQIGPILAGKFASGLRYEIGYLFGLTSASDQGMVKFIIGYEF